MRCVEFSTFNSYPFKLINSDPIQASDCRDGLLAVRRSEQDALLFDTLGRVTCHRVIHDRARFRAHFSAMIQARSILSSASASSIRALPDQFDISPRLKQRHAEREDNEWLREPIGIGRHRSVERKLIVHEKEVGGVQHDEIEGGICAGMKPLPARTT